MMRLPPFTLPRAAARRGRGRGSWPSTGRDAMAGGRRHRPLPEHEAPAVRAEGAGRACAAIRELRRHPRQRRATAWRSAPAPRSRAVAAHPEVARALPGARARRPALVSSPQLRNMGTLGGNVCVDTRCNYYNQSYEWRKAIGFCMKKDGDICLVAPGSPRCWAVSSSDTAPVLWALGRRGRRWSAPAASGAIPVAALYRDDGIEYLAKRAGRDPDRDPRCRRRTAGASTYLKLRRRGSFDFPVLGVAAAVRLDGGRRARGAHRARRRGLAAARGAGGRARPWSASGSTPRRSTRRPSAAARPAKPLDNTDLVYP